MSTNVALVVSVLGVAYAQHHDLFLPISAHAGAAIAGSSVIYPLSNMLLRLVRHHQQVVAAVVKVMIMVFTVTVTNGRL